jgi:hypothetical protein
VNVSSANQASFSFSASPSVTTYNGSNTSATLTFTPSGGTAGGTFVY